MPKITVLGIGNILLSDEGVGVRVVENLLSNYRFPPEVEIYDGGATGMALLPYIEDTEHLVVVDAVNGPGEPGSLYRYTLEDFRLNIPKKLSAHDIGFIECVTIADINDRAPKTVTVLGVKPQDIMTWKMELTDMIQSKVDDLVSMTVHEIRSLGVEAAPVNDSRTM